MTILSLRPVSPHLGADVLDLDLADAIRRDRTDIFEALRVALDAHIVLRLRGQSLTPEQIEAVGRRFGPLLSLKRKGRNARHLDGVAYLKIISNVVEADGTPLGDGSCAAQDWHSDGAAKPHPATYSFFYARTVPPTLPRTYWMNAYLVYESLPDALKERIAGLRVIHHEYPAGNEFPLPPSLPLEERAVGPRHPLVRVHPSTRRPSLYLPHRNDMLVEGMSEAESAALLGMLREHVAASPYWWGAAMEVDDFVIWDNRPALHRRDAWDPMHARVLWHLANEGETPIPFTGDLTAGRSSSHPGGSGAGR